MQSRVGSANLFNPIRPERKYLLDLKVHDDREVAKCLVRLSEEPGENFVGGAFQCSSVCDAFAYHSWPGYRSKRMRPCVPRSLAPSLAPSLPPRSLPPEFTACPNGNAEMFGHAVDTMEGFSIGLSWEEEVPMSGFLQCTYRTAPGTASLFLRVAMAQLLLMPGQGQWKAIPEDLRQPDDPCVRLQRHGAAFSLTED
eukprot:SAG31_NODE_1093_length_9952_cov_16.099056_8_plen_197_part_00